MSHDFNEAMSLEKHMISPELWDREVPPVVRVEGINDEGFYPTGYGRHPEHGWFVLSSGQGPFIIWAEWQQPQAQGVFEITDFDTPTPEPNHLRQPLIDTLTRLQKILQDTQLKT